MKPLQQRPGGWVTTAGRAVLFCLCCAIILVVLSGLTNSIKPPAGSIVAISMAAAGAFLLTILFARWEKVNLAGIGVIPSQDTFRRLITGLLLGSLLALLQPLLVYCTGHIKIERSPVTGFTTTVLSFLLYFAVACREEVAFRGYPLRMLSHVKGPVVAQAVVAVIFIAEHMIGGMTLLQAIIGSGLGAILFGLASLKTRGIALSTGIHTAWNFCQWAAGFKTGPGLYRVIVEKGYDAQVEQIGWMSYAVVMSVGIVIIYRWKKFV